MGVFVGPDVHVGLGVVDGAAVQVGRGVLEGTGVHEGRGVLVGGGGVAVGIDWFPTITTNESENEP